MHSNALFEIQDLEPHAGYLFRFALMKLRDDNLAREAVQDTFVAALESRTSFAGKSSLKTWLTAILKFKIIDLIRQQHREPTLSSLFDGRGEEGDDGVELDDNNRLAPTIPLYEHPDAVFEEKEFWAVFESGLTTLPTKTQQVFVMRDVLGYSTEEICKELKITETNCWVILHRARMGMRQYLGEHWFNTAELEFRRAGRGMPGSLAPAIQSIGRGTFARGNRSTQTAFAAL
ncbi:MAG: sigma-70 family RNA polymerase sigma factor [Burkholderiales bacterium]